MIDAGTGPMSGEEVRVREAADRAYRVQEGEEPKSNPPLSGERMLESISNATRRAPLPALAMAFMLGAMFARRR